MQQDQFTISEELIEVDSVHTLYTQLWGNQDALETIVFLHGGPGSGCSESHKQLFNPKKQKVLFFDQRGSGKSLPYGSLENNNTDALVEDINILTKYYGVDKFVLTGGSWGSTLALAYAIKYPGRVIAMVLRGIFTGRRVEIEFMDNGEARYFFPEIWEQFVASVPDEFKNRPGDYHIDKIFGDDPIKAKQSAFAYSRLEGSLIKLDDRFHEFKLEDFDPAPITIECHYLKNNCFFEDEYILKNADKLTMPISIVQGRYDFVCPPFTAYALNKVLPSSSLYWTIAGHSGSDRANVDMVKSLLSGHC